MRQGPSTLPGTIMAVLSSACGPRSACPGHATSSETKFPFHHSTRNCLVELLRVNPLGKMLHVIMKNNNLALLRSTGDPIAGRLD